MARLSEGAARQARSMESLQSTILTLISESEGKKIKLEKQVETCWQLTQKALPLVDIHRTLWDDFEGRTTVNTVTEEKLKEYLKDFSMQSYLRTLYNLLITKEF